MDREERRAANDTLRDALIAKLEANRGSVTLEDLMGHKDTEEPGEEESEQE